MIEGMTSWAQNLIVSVIIAAILEMILPNGNTKKYIKTVIGIYIVFVVISPIVGKKFTEILKTKDFDIDSYLSQSTYNPEDYNIDITNEENINQIYVENLKADILKRLAETGYVVEQIVLNVELEDEANYGRINSIKLANIRKQEEAMVNEISKIEISIGEEKQEENKSNLTNLDVIEIKTYLNQNYGIEKSSIILN